MAEIAKHESVIVKLNTGLGKTFIAVIVINHHLPETYKPLSEGGKRIVFICKTVHLVYQHAEFLRTQLPIPSEEVGIFHGTVAPGVWIDSWDQIVLISAPFRQRRQADSFEHLAFCVEMETVTIPHGILQSAEGQVGFADPVCDFTVDFDAA
nr:unnamed protein product [Spirometra erinaceieuropaei]